VKRECLRPDDTMSTLSATFLRSAVSAGPLGFPSATIAAP